MTNRNYDSASVYRYEPNALTQSYLELKATSTLHQASTSTRQQQLFDASNGGSFVVAATQLTGANLPDSTLEGYCQRAGQAIAVAAKQHGAHVVLLPELWSGPYFCQTQEADLLTLADPIDESNNVLLQRMQHLAKHYHVVLPVSLYERSNNALYNAVAMVDADGTLLGKYRKSHIPDGPGYQEKFYFTPGDSEVAGGVFESRVFVGLRLGVAICWDQWFPETARLLALQGCSVLLYPTAIGSEPQDPTLLSADHWQRVMQGHAAANMVPVVASNRYGTEILLKKKTTDNQQEQDYEERQRIHFYGKSFITDATGAKVAECEDNSQDKVVTVVSATIDPEQNRTERLAWGLFRDRRPDLYGQLLTKDGGGG